MQQKFDFTLFRTAVSVLIYVAMLGLVTLATYALAVGPRVFGEEGSWPLGFYFVVAYLDTLILGLGAYTLAREGPGLMRRVL